MALSASSSSVDEKLGHTSLNSPEKSSHVDLCPEDIPEETNDHEGDINVAEPSGLAPVSFSAMFRFATKFELFLDCIGLVAAAAAGAAQPVMTLFFANLTQDFVEFGRAVTEAKAGNAKAAARIPAAAAAFRRVAAHDALYLVYLGIGMMVCTFVYMTTWVYTGQMNTKRLRENYLRAVLRQDIAYFDNVGAGEVATRIQTDTHLVQCGTSEKVASSAQYLAAFVAGFVLAYIRNWRLALALSSVLPCVVLTGTLMNHFMAKYMQLSLQHVAESGSMAEEVISTIRTAQAFGAQNTLSAIYREHVEKAKIFDARAAIWNGSGLALFFFLVYAIYALAFYFGVTLINEGRASAGVVINVVMAILTGSLSLGLLAPEMQAITYARGAAAKLYETIDRVPTIDSADPGGLKPETIHGDIVLQNVKFSYPSRPDVPVVQDLSLTFPAGKTAALVGASGSGKSTVISLVERFYDPLSGVVKLDGVDLKELNVKWLRTQIGLVSQEPTLFATTIKGNVAHGLIGTKYEDASDEEKFALVKEACIKANADEFINNMPLGYDTLVGERGFLMSGGQKQRIAIARAIVSDPRILLLDEATSALDTQSEGIVQNALDKAGEGERRTTITIAHRLSTIRDAHCIFVVGGGRVLEQGTHEELLSKESGHYSRLVLAQALREKQETIDESNSDKPAESVPDADELIPQPQPSVPLTHVGTSLSAANQTAEGGLLVHGRDNEDELSLFAVFVRMAILNRAAWTTYGLGIVAASLSGGIVPSYGIVFAKGVTGFSDNNIHQRRHDGDRSALWLFLIGIGSMIVLGAKNYLFSSAATDLTAILRYLTFKATLRQDIEFFDKTENSAGGLTTRLSDNPQKVNGLAGTTLAAIVDCMATVVIGSILGLIFAWKIALVAIACIPVVTSAGYIRLRVVVLKDQSNKASYESSAQVACEAAGAIRTVASLTREADCSRIYSESLQEPIMRSRRSTFGSSLLFAISQSISFFTIGLTFWYGSRLVAAMEFTSFDFFVGLMSTMFGAISAGNVFNFVPDISSAKSAGSDIIKLLDTVPKIDADSIEGRQISEEKVRGKITFENVHFRYPTRPGVRVLRGFSINVEPGTYVALVGGSGSGKSTVIQLLERFYDPLAGRVKLDGELISELNIQEYRKHIALVSQEPTLYAGTIRFNILLGAIKPESEVTQEEIETACRNANILDFISGFDTEVGGKGSQLSGGQKQRIAIARAILRDPKVLLLDEATSALDTSSEKVVQEALDHAAKNRTTIAIAHRLSTIQNADCIYFLKDGRVYESGTHDQLLQKRGAYYEYVQMQK
ncbi:hypothetical protein PILCRDRAFT_483988 [Piloderma croceum F 1598]|uniref:P-loop containing nucleoside triphosphate hydrolase protein n=1 Tax=Piloderma croceum (strain F 1598) TaxID=765440 RepID=A0A0C3FBI9_PILCF|nr:hypothetical protein PILCRDRAFT_483988 [Piloderma croceum F 1598]